MNVLADHPLIDPNLKSHGQYSTEPLYRLNALYHGPNINEKKKLEIQNLVVQLQRPFGQILKIKFHITCTILFRLMR